MHHRDVAGDPAAALIEASNKSAAVVLGRGDAPAAALGSVCRALVQHAYCPVFLVG